MEKTNQLTIERDKNTEFTLITVYDNYKSREELQTNHGFSCLVKVNGENILFDTGTNGKILLSNLKKLNINPKEIDSIVLSHNHYDHTGGLFDLLEKNSELTVFLPESIPSKFKERTKSLGAGIVEVSDSIQISESVLSTGELGSAIKEQSLLVKTPKGLVIVTGCAHPGIVKIVRKAKELTGEDIYLVVGGFHLMNHSEPEIKLIISEFRELGVKRVAPSHCSGDLARRLFKEEFDENFIANGVGKEIQ